MNNDVAGPESQFNEIAFLYDELMDGVPYNGWVRYLHSILNRLNYRPESILDLCCGTGTVTRILSSQGYSVAGVDISAEMIKCARNLANNEGKSIEYFIQDAATFDIGRQFDLVISFFDSLNYIINENDLQSCFKQVHKHLHHNGFFIFDMNTEFALMAGFFNQSNNGSRSPVIYNWKSKYDPNTHICAVEMDFIYHDSIKKHVVHFQRAYEDSEIINMLHNAGLEIVSVYDAYTFKEVNSKSDRAFYIARKR